MMAPLTYDLELDRPMPNEEVTLQAALELWERSAAATRELRGLCVKAAELMAEAVATGNPVDNSVLGSMWALCIQIDNACKAVAPTAPIDLSRLPF